MIGAAQGCGLEGGERSRQPGFREPTRQDYFLASGTSPWGQPEAYAPRWAAEAGRGGRGAEPARSASVDDLMVARRACRSVEAVGRERCSARPDLPRRQTTMSHGPRSIPVFDVSAQSSSAAPLWRAASGYFIVAFLEIIGASRRRRPTKCKATSGPISSLVTSAASGIDHGLQRSKIRCLKPTRRNPLIGCERPSHRGKPNSSSPPIGSSHARA